MRLTKNELNAAMTDMPEWSTSGQYLQRDFVFADFVTALAFVNRVGAVAESHNHHPDILIFSWNKVKITTFTHDEGGITGKDFTLARAIDHVFLE